MIIYVRLKAPIRLKGIQGPVKTWQVMEKYTSRIIGSSALV